ncbi:PKD domain-containing protein [bacterium]|nr:PKD domain-containing protein [bacterium]
MFLFKRAAALAALLLISSSVLAACSGDSAGSPASPAADPDGPQIRRSDIPSPFAALKSAAPLAAQAAPRLKLPAPQALLEGQRGSSFTLAEGLRSGAQFDALLPNNLVSGTGNNGIYQPAMASGDSGLDELAYAVYNFTLPAYENRFVDITADWATAPAAGSAYLAIGNFDSGRWDFYAEPGQDALNFPDFNPYISAADKCLIVVICSAAPGASLRELQVYTPQPPEASLQSDVQDGVAPLSVFFDASASLDPDGSLASFSWDFDGDGEYNSSPDELLAEGQSTYSMLYGSSGGFEASVRVCDNDGLTDSASLIINVGLGPNSDPVALLDAEPMQGDAPLEVQFDASASSDPDGSLVDFEWDFDGDAAFNEADNGEAAARGNAQPPAVTYVDAGNYSPQVRVTDNGGAMDSAGAEIQVSTPGAVTAVLQADLTEGDAPLGVNFDGSNSLGAITDYEWDFDGDGVFNEAGAEAAAQGVATPAEQNYSPSEQTVSLRVSDGIGNEDTDSLQITAHGWLVIELAETGVYPSVAVINGHPAVCYHNWDPLGTCRYQYSNSLHGSNAADWTAPVSVESAVVASGWQSSLFEASGAPAIAYFSTGTGQVYYERALSATGGNGADWASASILIGAGGISYYGFDAEMVNGNPAIAWYREGGGSELRYARASNSTGAAAGDWSGGTLISIATSGAAGMGKFLSMATIGGTPAVSFLDATSGNVLKYAHSSSSSGGSQADWLITTVAGTVLESSALMEIDGAPAIAYAVQNSGTYYRRAATSSGDQQSDWDNGSFINLQISSPFGNGLDMDIVNGHPAVLVHRTGNPYQLRYAEAANADGSTDGDWSGGINEIADSAPSSTGEWMEMAVLPGGQVCFVGRGWTEQIDQTTFVEHPIRYGVKF